MWRIVNYILFVFTLFYNLILVGQQNKIDSILNVLITTKEDTNKVNLLNSLARELRITGEYKNAFDYSSQSIILSDKFNFKKGNNKVSLGNGKTITSFFSICLIGYFLNDFLIVF